MKQTIIATSISMFAAAATTLGIIAINRKKTRTEKEEKEKRKEQILSQLQLLATRINHNPNEGVRLRKYGKDLLNDFIRNKGFAFTTDERERYALRGLLPNKVYTQEEQVKLVIQNVGRLDSPIQKYTYMMQLADRNERLFFRVVFEYTEEFMPILYTPTVGKACQNFAHLYLRPRGMYITIDDKGEIYQVLQNWRSDDVRVIVVTDGERILGLGDLGASGMGIPVGKLMLYTACGEVHPKFCLPITLDVGTNNEGFLSDSLYHGIRRPRVRGKKYDEFIDEFMSAVVRRWGSDTLIQFEDFANINAFRLLEKYRNDYCCFNDDIQGTASVVLSAFYSSMRITGGDLVNQKYLFVGAGEAGIGMGTMLLSVIKETMPEEEAKKRINYVDSRGLITKTRLEAGELQSHKVYFAHDLPKASTLLEALDIIKPTALIGASGQPQIFTQEVCEKMLEFSERPIIFALSNPTSKAECTAEQAYKWTNGACVFASGSPFPAVRLEDGRIFRPGQSNNSWIFPAIGFAVSCCHITRIPDEIFTIAARELANLVEESDLETGCLFPPMSQMRETSLQISLAVSQYAFESGIAAISKPRNIEEYLRNYSYKPFYVDKVYIRSTTKVNL